MTVSSMLAAMKMLYIVIVAFRKLSLKSVSNLCSVWVRRWNVRVFFSMKHCYHPTLAMEMTGIFPIFVIFSSMGRVSIAPIPMPAILYFFIRLVNSLFGNKFEWSLLSASSSIDFLTSFLARVAYTAHNTQTAAGTFSVFFFLVIIKLVWLL